MAGKMGYPKGRPRLNVQRDIEELKAIRERTRTLTTRLRPPAYTNGLLFALRLAGYVAERQKAEKPLTVAGYALAVGVNNGTLREYASGQKDHLIDDVIAGVREDTQADVLQEELKRAPADVLAVYKILTADAFAVADDTVIYFSDVLAVADTIASLEREERLYSKGRVADIFALKARDGWQENDSPNTQNNTLVINSNSADEALKLLGYTKQDN